MKTFLLLATFGAPLSLVSAASVSIFLDNGTNLATSTNSGTPYSNTDRDVSWDVLASAESGLSAVGGAVMEVRMLTLNVNGDSRQANGGGGNGLAVTTGGNNAWLDGSTREGAVFQFKVYSDLGKTTEVTGLTFTLSSVLARMSNNSNHVVDAFAGSGALTFDDGTSAIPAPVDNNSNIFLGGNLMNAGGDSSNQTVQDLGLGPTSFTGPAPDVYAIASSGVSFDEDGTFWIRRRNLAGADAAYQLGALTFDVIPEPSSAMLLSLAACACLRRRR